MGEIIREIIVKGSNKLEEAVDKAVIEELQENGVPTNSFEGDIEFFEEEIYESLEDAKDFLMWEVEDVYPWGLTQPVYYAFAAPFYGGKEPSIIREYKERINNYLGKMAAIDKQFKKATTPSEKKELGERYDKWDDRYGECLDLIYKERERIKETQAKWLVRIFLYW